MIAINKAGYAVPVVLTGDGASQTTIDKNNYDINRLAYHHVNNSTGTKFAFDSKIYGDETVKSLLITIQHGKCCFCESKMIHVSDGDVEHFRPKAGFLQNDGDGLTRPGYYWLAYDWNNLFLACLKCNQRHKKNLFPLSNPSKRAVNHHRNLAFERPLFVHPSETNPEDHIYFIDQIPTYRTRQGQVTIDELGLGRTQLNEMREEKLIAVKNLEKALNDVTGTPYETSVRSRLLDTLRRYIQGGGEYTNMFKSNFQKYLPEL